MTQKRSLTFISRHAPYSSTHARAGLDMVLAAAVFDQKVQLIFMDDGVYQLIQKQQPEAIHSKNLGAALEALPLYGVEDILVDANSLPCRGLKHEDLLLPGLQLCDDEQLREIIRQSDQVFIL